MHGLGNPPCGAESQRETQRAVPGVEQHVRRRAREPADDRQALRRGGPHARPRMQFFERARMREHGACRGRQRFDARGRNARVVPHELGHARHAQP